VQYNSKPHIVFQSCVIDSIGFYLFYIVVKQRGVFMNQTKQYMIFLFFIVLFSSFGQIFVDDYNHAPYKNSFKEYKTVIRNGQNFIICRDAGEVAFGTPKNIEKNRKYYEEGMEAGKVKNYKLAAEMLRYSFYQVQDSYRFFWYIYYLSILKAWEVIDKECESVNEDFLYHSGYLTWARSIWAGALKEVGKFEKSVENYIYILKNNPKSSYDAAYFLTNHYWYEDRLGPVFIKHNNHKELSEFIVSQIESVWKEKKYAGGGIFEHLVIATSLALIEKRIDDGKFYLGLLKRIDDNCDFIDNIESANNRTTILSAFDYYLNNNPLELNTKPYEFKWINLYVPEIQGFNQKTNKSTILKISKSEYEKRIYDTIQNWAFVPIFYYYISQGKILMSYEYKVLNGKIGEIDRGGRINSNTVNPYPSQFLYDNIRNFDGLMWWHPSYENVLYLGGPNVVTFFPNMLYTLDWNAQTTMPLSASYKVLIHEIFHNYANRLGIDSGHNWLAENKNKWFSSYREKIEVSVDKKVSELTWYELLLRDEGNKKDHSKLLIKDAMWVPGELSYKKISALIKKYGQGVISQVNKIILQSDLEFQKKNNQKGIELLYQALKIVPEHPRALFKVAHNLHWTFNKRDDAQKYYDRFLDMYEDINDTDIALIYTINYYMNRNPQKVLDIIKRNGKNPPTFTRLSEYKLAEVKALKTLKRDSEAISIATQFIDDERNTMKEKFGEFLNN